MWKPRLAQSYPSLSPRVVLATMPKRTSKKGRAQTPESEEDYDREPKRSWMGREREAEKSPTREDALDKVTHRLRHGERHPTHRRRGRQAGRLRDSPNRHRSPTRHRSHSGSQERGRSERPERDRGRKVAAVALSEGGQETRPHPPPRSAIDRDRDVGTARQATPKGGHVSHLLGKTPATSGLQTSQDTRRTMDQVPVTWPREGAKPSAALGKAPDAEISPVSDMLPVQRPGRMGGVGKRLAVDAGEGFDSEDTPRRGRLKAASTVPAAPSSAFEGETDPPYLARSENVARDGGSIIERAPQMPTTALPATSPRRDRPDPDRTDPPVGPTDVFGPSQTDRQQGLPFEYGGLEGMGDVNPLRTSPQPTLRELLAVEEPRPRSPVFVPTRGKRIRFVDVTGGSDDNLPPSPPESASSARLPTFSGAGGGDALAPTASVTPRLARPLELPARGFTVYATETTGDPATLREEGSASPAAESPGPEAPVPLAPTQIPVTTPIGATFSMTDKVLFTCPRCSYNSEIYLAALQLTTARGILCANCGKVNIYRQWPHS